MAEDREHQHRTEQEEARERLKRSIDALAERANLQVQMQKEPLKMLGGASAVGAVVGLVAGRQLRRSKKIYVDAASPAKHQKGLIKAQHKQRGQGVGGALTATLATLAVKTLTDRVLAPKLEQIANNLLEKAGQAPEAGARPGAPATRSALPTRSAAAVRAEAPITGPAVPSGAAAFLKKPAGGASPTATDSPSVQAAADGSAPPRPQAHPGIVPMPASHVEAKAQGTPLSPEEKTNPNVR